MEKPTLEEIAELVTFDRDEDGKLIISTVVEAHRVEKAKSVGEVKWVKKADWVGEAKTVKKAELVVAAKWVNKAEQVVEIITPKT